MSGTAHLRRQLDDLDDSLRAFEDPIVAERPGLRLMAKTLTERRDHIARTIRSNETCSIDVTMHGAAVDGEAAPAGLVVAVVAAVRDAVVAAVAGVASPEARAAAELHVAAVAVEEDDVRVELRRRPGPVAAQPTDADTGVPLVEQACARVTDTLRAAADGDRAGDGDIAAALARLGAAMVGAQVTMTWSFTPFRLDPADVTLDQAAAQRLATATR